MSSSAGTSLTGDDAGLFVGFPLMRNNVRQSQNQSDSKSVQSTPSVGSARSKASNTSRRSTISAPSGANETNNQNKTAHQRRFSFDTISTKANSTVPTPFDIDTAGVNIGPPSESSYESYSQTTPSDESSRVSSNGKSGQKSNILISSRPPLSVSKKISIENDANRSVKSSLHSHNSVHNQSNNLAGDFMGWGAASSTQSDNLSTRSGKSIPENGSTAAPNNEDIVYEDFPERPRGDNLSVCSEPRSMKSIKIEDEFDSRRPWRKVQPKEDTTKSLSASSSDGTTLSQVDGDNLIRQNSNRNTLFEDVDMFRSTNTGLGAVDVTRGCPPSESTYTSEGLQSSSTITELRIVKDALYKHQYRADFRYGSSESADSVASSDISDSMDMNQPNYPIPGRRKEEPFRRGPPLPRSDHSVSSRGSDDRSYSNQSNVRVSDDGSYRSSGRRSDDGSHSSRSRGRGSDDGSHSNRSSVRSSDDGSNGKRSIGRESGDGFNNNQSSDRWSNDGSCSNRSNGSKSPRSIPMVGDDRSNSSRQRSRGSDDGSDCNLSRGGNGSDCNQSISRGGDDETCSNKSSTSAKSESSRDRARNCEISSTRDLDSCSTASNSSDDNLLHGDTSKQENNQNITSLSPLFRNPTDSDPSGKRKKSANHLSKGLPQLDALDETKPYPSQDGGDCDYFTIDVERAKSRMEEQNELVQREAEAKDNYDIGEQLVTGGSSLEASLEEKKKSRYDCRSIVIAVLVVGVIAAVIGLIVTML